MTSFYGSEGIGFERRLLLSAPLALAVTEAAARMIPADDDEIARRLDSEGLRIERPGIEMFVDARETSPEWEAGADRVADGIGVVERFLDRTLDTKRYGNGPIRVYAAPGIMPSHVYRGYSHPKFAKAAIYFPLAMVRNDNEPYLHELTHLVLWAYGSHTLREGFAHYVMLAHRRLSGRVNRIHLGISERDVADAKAAQTLRGPLGRRLLNAMGANGIPEKELAVGEARDVYYVTSYSFVSAMLDVLDRGRFMELHVADDVEASSVSLTGRDMPQWRAHWLKRLGIEPSEVPS